MAWTLHEGDCLEVMHHLPDQSVDMILCDLPYGTTQNAWDSIIPLEELWPLYRHLVKPRGAIVLTAAQPFTTVLIASNLHDFRYCWVWDKEAPTGFLNAKKQPLRVTEDIAVFSRETPPFYPVMRRGSLHKRGGGIRPGGSDNWGEYNDAKSVSDLYYPDNLLSFPKARTVENEHPTQKPIALFEYLIQTYTLPGDTVLDNCAGSGTTGVAADLLGRNSILIEREPEYCAIIRRRMEEVTAQGRLFA
jgi:site-specific DNA-methyltransferase (adenine-specific)